MTRQTSADPHAELARQAAALDVDALVYVPAGADHAAPETRRPVVRIIDSSAAADAEGAGFDWLGLDRPRPPVDDADGSVLVPLRAAGNAIVGDEVVGVVVATAGSARQWTPEQRAQVRLIVESHAREIATQAEVPVDDVPPPVVGGPVAIPDEHDLAAELRNAVVGDELHLDYQPEFDLATGQIVAVEALVRWRHPQVGELGPDWFIALAERSDLIVLVGDWVLANSVAALASWNAALPGLDLLLRVNVSPVQMDGDGLVDSVAEALRRHGVDGHQLCIELTEKAPLTDVDDVARSIRALKELGVSAAMDDLATGYSALSRLRTLRVDDVKIDRSLVSGIDSDRRAQAIMTALIGLALNIGVGIVAEGVETAAEARTLLELGCVRAQGHHLGRPMDANAVLRLLTERESRD